MSRTFLLVTPAMRGVDVEDLQREVNRWLAHWGVHLKLDVDGVYGVTTKRAATTVGYGLGVGRDQFAHGISPETRVKIRHAGESVDYRSVVERQRARDRRGWVDRLAKRYASKANGPTMAAEYALKMAKLGITEKPPSSNRGPYIDEWQRISGYAPGVSWCLCFVNACWVAGGWPASVLPWHGYCPTLETMARGGEHGLKWHGPAVTPQLAWAALFTEGGVAGHVELAVKGGKPLRDVGGNTSKGDGSPNEGGGVFAHNFSTYRGLPLRGYVELPWLQL